MPRQKKKKQKLLDFGTQNDVELRYGDNMVFLRSPLVAALKLKAAEARMTFDNYLEDIFIERVKIDAMKDEMKAARPTKEDLTDKPF